MAGDKLKLLVPTNFSGKSEMALDFALGFFQGVNTEIFLFHVYEDSTKNFRRLDQLNVELMEHMKKTVMSAVERLAQRGIVNSVDNVHRRMSHGRAAQEILTMAEAIGCDVIIMGAPTQSQFKKFATQVPCSLVLLKQKDASQGA